MKKKIIYKGRMREVIFVDDSGEEVKEVETPVKNKKRGRKKKEESETVNTD